MPGTKTLALPGGDNWDVGLTYMFAEQVLLDGMEVGLAGLHAGQAALRAARSLDGGLSLSLQV